MIKSIGYNLVASLDAQELNQMKKDHPELISEDNGPKIKTKCPVCNETRGHKLMCSMWLD